MTNDTDWESIVKILMQKQGIKHVHITEEDIKLFSYNRITYGINLISKAADGEVHINIIADKEAFEQDKEQEA